MALAKKCDRCNELYETKNYLIKKQQVNGLMILERDSDNTHYYARGYLDLCPKCLKSFNTWLKMEFEQVFAMKDDGIHVDLDYADKEESNDQT